MYREMRHSNLISAVIRKRGELSAPEVDSSTFLQMSNGSDIDVT